MKKFFGRIKDKWNSGVKYKALFSFLVFLIVAAVMWIYPFKAQNISMRIHTEGVEDGTVLEFQIQNEDAYGKVQDFKTYVCNKTVLLKVNPEFLKMDSIRLFQGEYASKLTSLEVMTGNYGKEDKTLKTIALGGRVEQKGEGAEFSGELIREIRNSRRNNYFLKMAAAGILLFVWAVFVLYFILEKRFEKYQAASVCGILLFAFFYCVFMKFNHDNVVNYHGSKVQNEYLDITNGDIVAEQEFTAIANRISEIAVFFRLNDEPDCGIVMELVREKDGQILQKEIINPDSFDGEEVTYTMELDNYVSAIDEKFLVRLYCVENNGSGTVWLASSSEDTDLYGQLIVNGERKNKDLLHQIGYLRLFNLTYAKLFVVFFALLLSICVLCAGSEKHAKKVIWLIYASMLLFAAFKMMFYCHYVGKTPDESKHIAYVAYLEKENVIIPDLPEMRAISKIYDDGKVQIVSFSDGVNYLRHPPLYYQILRLVNAYEFHEDGTIRVEVFRLRLFSIGMAFLAFVLLFYIGFTRLKGGPHIHLLYTAVCVSVPMMTYGSAGLTNDTLTFLTVTVYFLGILRFAEKRRNALTYWLIAIGMTGTLLTKVTAGIMVAISAVIVLTYYLIKEKCYKELLSVRFLSTIPVYFLAVVFYLLLFKEYGTFQPGLNDIMSVESVRNSGFYTEFAYRDFRTFGEYINNYLRKFIGTWTGIASHVSLQKPENVGVGIQTAALSALWFIPLLYLLKTVRRNNTHAVGVISMYIGIFVTFLMQFVHAYNGYCSRGYEGAFQSRYYLCGMVLFAFAAATVVQNFEAGIDLKQFYGQKIKRVSFLGTIFFVAVLFYEDFVFFLLNFTSYVMYYR